MLKVDFTKQAEKFLRRLPLKQAKQLLFKVQELSIHPQPHDCKKIKGYPFLRVDVGEYRIIYNHDNKTLNISIIDKRNDDSVYKRMKRSL